MKLLSLKFLNTFNFVTLDAVNLWIRLVLFQLKHFKMNSALTKVSNLKINRSSKIALTIASSSFFLYALGQAPIFKNILTSAFSCSG